MDQPVSRGKPGSFYHERQREMYECFDGSGPVLVSYVGYIEYEALRRKDRRSSEFFCVAIDAVAGTADPFEAWAPDRETVWEKAKELFSKWLPLFKKEAKDAGVSTLAYMSDYDVYAAARHKERKRARDAQMDAEVKDMLEERAAIQRDSRDMMAEPPSKRPRVADDRPLYYGPEPAPAEQFEDDVLWEDEDI
jgi:hypothetical protein